MKHLVRVGAERVPLVEREEEHVDERQDAEDRRGSTSVGASSSHPTLFERIRIPPASVKVPAGARGPGRRSSGRYLR